MAFSGGTFTREGAVHSGSTLWQDSASDGDATISSAEHDIEMNDVAGALNELILRDGSNAWTDNLDAGSKKIESLAAGSATGNSGRWDEDVSAISLDGTTLHIEYNGAKADVTVDIASVGSAGEMTLSTAQTVTGKKTFTTATTPITDLRVLDTTYRKISVLTPASGVAVDTTAASRFWLNNNQAMTLTFTIPTGSDTDLGANYCTEGYIIMRNATGNGAITISVGGDDSEEIGGRPTGSTEIYTLVYQILVIGSTRYSQFTWVTP